MSILQVFSKPTRKRYTGQSDSNRSLAGIDFEEAGEKWRAGDAEKSARFFTRAIDVYNDGLARFPESFDLTYNNNTGQVLTSMAEWLTEAQPTLASLKDDDPLQLLKEALGCFQSCAKVQQCKLMQQGEGHEADAQHNMEVDHEQVTDAAESPVLLSKAPIATSSSQDGWATIEEPITKSALMDTLLAQLETLTSMCGVLSARAAGDLEWIVAYRHEELTFNLLEGAMATERDEEYSLADARYECALADANFSQDTIDIFEYERVLAKAQKSSQDGRSKDPQLFCDLADGELVFNATVERFSERVIGSISGDGLIKTSIMLWKHLTKALELLTSASKLPNATNLPRIHLRRGDCEMLRRRLGFHPWNCSVASKSASTLLKNADIYYRGAARLAQAESATDEVNEASVKEAIVTALAGDPSKLRMRAETEIQSVQDIIGDSVEEGLL
ncbi:MAG: hypothetical protein Q9174_002183, partial [Haloplaca sp. 1 TL-2023]